MVNIKEILDNIFEGYKENIIVKQHSYITSIIIQDVIDSYWSLKIYIYADEISDIKLSHHSKALYNTRSLNSFKRGLKILDNWVSILENKYDVIVYENTIIKHTSIDYLERDLRLFIAAVVEAKVFANGLCEAIVKIEVEEEDEKLEG